MIARTEEQPGVDLLEDAACEVRRGSMVHGDDDYAAVSASEECGHPGGGVGSPEDNAITFVNLARDQFASKPVGGGSNVAVGGADYTIAVRLGKGCFSAEA